MLEGSNHPRSPDDLATAADEACEDLEHRAGNDGYDPHPDLVWWVDEAGDEVDHQLTTDW